MFVALAVLAPILLILVLWASFAPLNAAAIASGEIVLSSDRKTVQHLEGGLITEIYVREGADVREGQPLLVVHDLVQQSRKEALVVQLVNTNAMISRLIAERDGLDRPDFADISQGLDVSAATHKRFAATHLGVFLNITQSERSTEELAASRKVQIAREIDGLQAQLDAKTREADLVRSELGTKRAMLERGISTETQVNALARSEAVLEGEIGALLAAIARLAQSELDQDVEILRLKNERASVMLGELQEAQVSAENLRQELRTLRDRQDRAVIRAPVSGVVLGMQLHTIGAVVSPGTPLMDIVPHDDDLIIEARVDPTDIDLVAPGMAAQVQLSAFKAKRVDKLDAVLETISGDILVDELTGVRYFLARLRVSEDDLAALPKDVELSPGMPADVFLIAGERTMMQYLMAPISDAAAKAFKEE
jgi:HlyD family type I secretion membrane fusion protein